MTPTVDQLLSEFMDAWATGRRPELDAYLARADPADRARLAGEIGDYLDWAPDPAYDERAVAALEADPLVATTFAVAARERSLWPSLLPVLRARAGASTAQLAQRVVAALGLDHGEDKVQRYLEQMEDGTLAPRGVSDRVLAALAPALRITPRELRAAGDLGGWAAAGAFARAEPDAPAGDVAHLEVAADLLGSPAPQGWDEVDDLFRGGAAQR